MSDIVRRTVRMLAQLPGRIVRGVPWAHMEYPGLGVGKVHTEDADEMEQQRRRDREAWRRDHGAT